VQPTVPGVFVHPVREVLPPSTGVAVTVAVGYCRAGATVRAGLAVDDVSAFNKDRWEALAQARSLFSRPWLDLDAETAPQRIDPWGHLGSVRGKDVLCLAGGGGQQSAAFAVAGARVSVLDIAAGQLARDREAARHYGYDISAIQGDMRDLSAFGADRFDVVCQPYSINFVPDCREVFAEVARVLRPGGVYAFQAANPFAVGLGTRAWNGHAYEVHGFYEQGVEVESEDEAWVLPDSAERSRIRGPREYRQLLGTLVNGLADLGFVLLRVEEETGRGRADDPPPGGWDHFVATMPPWLYFWARLASPEARRSAFEVSWPE
jgi:SAM-dependent methyltransferase